MGNTFQGQNSTNNKRHAGKIQWLSKNSLIIWILIFF